MSFCEFQTRANFEIKGSIIGLARSVIIPAIFPEPDEIEMLKSFDGDKSKLPLAEDFIMKLIEVPK